MTEAASLIELAERVEAATGRDRELDALIHIEAGLAEGNTVAFKTGWCAGSETNPRPVEAPAYTASIDAAMSLVPEGWMWVGGSSPTHNAGMAVTRDGTQDGFDARAATPALALCAAALRARASL